MFDAGQQPITLEAQSPHATNPSLPVVTIFEVAGDAAFTTLLQAHSVTGNSLSTVSVSLDPVPPGRYHWRVRSRVADAELLTEPKTFRVALRLAPPIPVLPATGAAIGALSQPVVLAARLPSPLPPGAGLVAMFDIASDEHFAAVISSGRGTISGEQAVFQVDRLPFDADYYWRVRLTAPDALDAVSPTASFRIGSGLRTGPHRLTIYDVPWSSCIGAFRGEAAVNGDVAINGEGWQFVGRCLGGSVPGTQALSLSLTGTEMGAVTGHGAARFCALDTQPLLLSLGLGPHDTLGLGVPLMGVLDPSGTVSGTLTGTLDFLHSSFGIRGACPGTFRWTLAPR